MTEIVELQNVEEVCRLCLSGSGPRSSVFGAQDSPVSLAAKIQACLSIQISISDKLSTRICAQCVRNVDQWHNYKETCLKSQMKLQQWLDNQIQSVPMVVTIKDEPIDLDFDDNIVEVISDQSDLRVPNLNPVNGMMEDGPLENSMDAVCNILDKDHSTPVVDPMVPSKDPPQLEKQFCTLPIKTEIHDNYDTDGTIEIESVSGSELIFNPFSRKGDIVMEADSTQRTNTSLTSSAKKKMRRGPHTHYKGITKFKQKCNHCQIYLHSKYSFTKHMEKFHSEYPDVPDIILPEDEVEAIEDVEDELITLENEAPLTQVQENIIGQLKTFSCYSCRTNFSSRKTTLIHIRQHMPDLRPFTCIACLTEFADRSQYKTHCGSSFECAMKIALVVPKHGKEQFFTCNMCLRSVGDRKELMAHLTGHSDKQFAELASPSRSPPKLVPMTPVLPRKETVVEKPQLTKTVIRDPYMGGDPLYNHPCDLCGMIYKYKSNMLKHRELCIRLAPEVRTSYRCADCGKTFLVFKKFHGHLTGDHKIKKFPCVKCDAVFSSPSDFLAHYETHRASMRQQTTEHDTSPKALSSSIEDWDSFEAEMNSSKSKTPNQKFRCALCSEEFASRGELVEHRNIHLKVKIYSCVICRSMFSSAGALEIHMKDHGIQESNDRHSLSMNDGEQSDNSILKSESMNNTGVLVPGVSNVNCKFCVKSFSNVANARRHEKNLHGGRATPTTCTICLKTFPSQKHCTLHLEKEHKQKVKELHECPHCPKTFVLVANLNVHISSAHKSPRSQNEDGYACDECGKSFAEETSMKRHRASHRRSKSRKSGQVEAKPQISTEPEQVIDATIERPAKARKSFPNPPPPAPIANFQCQVCDDKFADVTDLRKHLWDVHCARNKPEKLLTENELQCEICSTIFSEKETLRVHMQWHNANPILSDIPKVSITCEVCGKNYSSRKGLTRHKRIHQASTVASIKSQTTAKKPVPTPFMCTICRKVFSSLQSLQRHRANFHGDAPNSPHPEDVVPKEINSVSEPKAKRMKFETEDVARADSGKKPVMCHPCKKMFPNMSILYRHKQQVHKQFLSKQPAPTAKQPAPAAKPPLKLSDMIPTTEPDGSVTCNICTKNCNELSYLQRHFTLKHIKPPAKKPQVPVESTKNKVPTDTSSRPKSQRKRLSYTNFLLCCTLCDRHVFTPEAMSEHIRLRHNTKYDATVNKNFHREVDLTNYDAGGIDFKTQECPHCHVKYPNFRLLKVHYFKFHDSTD